MKLAFIDVSNRIKFKTSNNNNHRAMQQLHITSPAWF